MQHKNNLLMESQLAAIAKKKSVVKPKWIAQYWPLMAMALFTVVAWIPYLSHRQNQPPQSFMIQWGATPEGLPIIDPRVVGHIVTDGSFFSDYQGKYKLAGAEMVHVSPIDIYDEPLILKSSLYDIRPGQIEIMIPYTAEFREIRPHVSGGVNYILFLIPKGIEMSAFGTLHQAQNAGVKIVSLNVGP